MKIKKIGMIFRAAITRVKALSKPIALFTCAAVTLGMSPYGQKQTSLPEINHKNIKKTTILPPRKLNLSKQENSSGIAQAKQAIMAVSKETNTPYDLLLKIAMKESTLNPLAWNKTTNACGVMQITPKTHLELLYLYGKELPKEYKNLAHSIVKTKTEKLDNGKVWIHYIFQKGKNVKSLKPLCNDPYVSAFLGEKLLQRSLERLENNLHRYKTKYKVETHRELNYTDAYLVHMLGALPAAKFIALNDNPHFRNFKASDYLKREARSNPNIFYKRNSGKKQSHSFATIYSSFAKKIGTEKLPVHLYGLNSEVMEMAYAKN